jgi:hypothetical protein
VEFDLTRKEYNVVAWALGGQDPSDIRDRDHRRAIAGGFAGSGASLIDRARRALAALDPRSAQAPAADCCAA